MLKLTALTDNAIRVCVAALTLGACAGAPPSADQIAGRGGGSLTGVSGLNYVSIHQPGARPVYETGSRFDRAAAPAPEIVAAARISARADGRGSDIEVEGPEPLAAPLARTLADGLDAAARLGWPGIEDQIRLSVTLDPDSAGETRQRFRPAGPPWPMAFTLPVSRAGDPQARARAAGTIGHEAYHLMAAIHGGGRYDARYAARPDAGLILEETAAYLLSDCIQLALGEAADASAVPAATLDIVDEISGETHVRRAPFDAATLAPLLMALEAPHERGRFPAAIVYLGFYHTLFAAHCGGEARIEPGSPGAAALIETCRTTGLDAARIEARLQALAAG